MPVKKLSWRNQIENSQNVEVKAPECQVVSQTTLREVQLPSSHCLLQRNYRPAPDRVGVNYLFLQQGEQTVYRSFGRVADAMLLKSRENADLFRLPERWRRRLRMRLACSLASVSLHTQKHAHMHTLYIVRIPPHRQMGLMIRDSLVLNHLPVVGHTGKILSETERVNVTKSKREIRVWENCSGWQSLRS